MKIPKPTIPILRRIADLSRQYAKSNRNLLVALRELDQADADGIEARKEALEERGLDCVVCGKKFLPLPDDYSNCCSIGCRFSERKDK
jgi:hypothetical protein